MQKPIEPDQRLMFEYNTLLPKIGLCDVHRLSGQMRIYERFCNEGKVDLANKSGEILRQMVHKARMSLLN